MRILFKAAFFAVALITMGSCDKAGKQSAQHLEFAKGVMQDVLRGLVNSLQQKVAAEGAAKAVPFCNEFAPQYGKGKMAEWAARARTELGADTFRFRRISAQPRNPKNTPTERQAQILAAWSRDGATVVQYTEAGKSYTMHPILISQPLCLSCHGTAETADKAAIAAVQKLYPEDKATGYKLGDLRGAFVTEAELAGN